MAVRDLAGIALVLVTSQRVVDPGGVWPTWPTEIDRFASAVRAVDEGTRPERVRLAALHQLERFATEVIANDIVLATGDPSSEVRRKALRLCYERQIMACRSAAAAIWSGGLDPGVRIAALRVMALEPGPHQLALLLRALREPTALLRASAAEVLGGAPLTKREQDKVRIALLAKLSDPASLVRQRSLESLGRLGRGLGALTISKRLEDPEPTVRSAAAETLGLHHDPRSVPALMRALAAPNEPAVSHAILRALVLLPGPQVAQVLLRAVDAPPSGLEVINVAGAIGLRPNAEPPLIEGLVARAGEPNLRTACIHALLLLGRRASSAIARARQRGVEASLDLEFERLQHAWGMPASTRTPRQPPITATSLTSGPLDQRIAFAVKYAEQSPSSAAHVALATLEATTQIASQRPWWAVLARLAGTPRDRAQSRDRPLAWTRMIRSAGDRTLSDGDRCLAVAALASAATAERPIRSRAVARLDGLLADPRANVRACVAMVRPWFGNRAAHIMLTLLTDPDPRVRTAAILGSAGHRPLVEALAPTVVTLATIDPDASVKQAAAAFETRTVVPGLSLFFDTAQTAPWAIPGVDGMELHSNRGDRQTVPAVIVGTMRLALVAGLPPTAWTPLNEEP